MTLPVKLFYMIRHGETVANAGRYAAGALDTPLTETGRQQPRDQRITLEALKPRPVRIVHSPLARAVDTARILNENLALPISSNRLIAEQDYGDWARRPWDEVLPRLKARETPPNGESDTQFSTRVIKGLTEILSVPQDPVLIVTHGGVFNALMAAYDCEIQDVHNCHLYAFVPDLTGSTRFPWTIRHDQAPLANKGAPVQTLVPVTTRNK